MGWGLCGHRASTAATHTAAAAPMMHALSEPVRRGPFREGVRHCRRHSHSRVGGRVQVKVEAVIESVVDASASAKLLRMRVVRGPTDAPLGLRPTRCLRLEAGGKASPSFVRRQCHPSHQP